MAKLPWFKFYADAWLSDEALRACSMAARGLWIDMLSLMHKSDRRGYLKLNGKPVTTDQLARMTGCSPGEVSHHLQELMNSGVASASDDGTIFSRRMVRDDRKSRKCSEAGKTGGGNPTFKGVPKGASKGRSKGVPKGTSNFSISDSESIYLSYPRKESKRKALEAIARALERIAAGEDRPDWHEGDWPPEDPVGWLRARAQAFAETPAGRAGRFTPHPTTWFNGGRYSDHDSEWQRARQAGDGDSGGPKAGRDDRRRGEFDYDYSGLPVD